jgi:O-antigen ligase
MSTPVTRSRTHALALLPSAPALVVFAWWALGDGGYAPDTWMPGTLLLLGLALAVFAVRGVAPLRQNPVGTAALGALAAYTAWSLASALWADAPAVALEGGQRTLAYLACFGLFLLLPWTATTLRAAVAAFALAVAGVGLVTLLRAGAAEAPVAFFNDARLAEPLGYQNATAALWSLAAFPALLLAARPEVHPAVRPPLLAASGLLLGLSLLGQSRGWVFTAPVVALACLVLAPGRVRLLAHAVPVVLVGLLVLPALLEPYAVGGGQLASAVAPAMRVAIDEAVRALLLGSAGLLAAGVALVLAERLAPAGLRDAVRLPRPPAVPRAAVAAVAGVALLAGAAVAGGPVADRAERAFADFRTFDAGTPGRAPESRLGGDLGSTRYDFWRVAVAEWRAHPVTGLGQDNFAQAYLRGRGVDYEEPRWVHSLPLRLLAHTGLVGLLLFGAFLAAAAVAGRRAWRRMDAAGRAVLGAAAVPLVAWTVQGSVDWLWEYPGLSGPALALAGAATALARRRVVPARPPGRPALAVAVVAFAAAGATLVPPWIAARDVEIAASTWPGSEQVAYERLARAARLAPLDARPALVEGQIALRAGRLERATAAFAEAARREPADWFAHFNLGLAATERGDTRAAVRHMRDAARLNPREPLVLEARRRLLSKRPLLAGEARSEARRRVQRRLGRTPGPSAASARRGKASNVRRLPLHALHSRPTRPTTPDRPANEGKG